MYALGTLQNASKGKFLAGAGTIELSFDGVAAEASIPHNIHIHEQYPLSLAEVCANQPSLQGLPISQDAVTIVSPVKGMNFGEIHFPDEHYLALKRYMYLYDEASIS